MGFGGGSEQRRFYRLRYPISDRVMLHLDGEAYPVCEISQGGLRFCLDDFSPIRLQQRIRGIILLHSGGTTRVEGIVLRIVHSEVAVQLVTLIPPNIITEEEMYLLKAYPLR